MKLQRKHADAANTQVGEKLILAEGRMKVHTLNCKHYAFVFEDSDTSKETQMGQHTHTYFWEVHIANTYIDKSKSSFSK